jgi:hypothetical protein
MNTKGMKRFSRPLYPWRWIAVWAFCAVLILIGSIKRSELPPHWILPVASLVAFLMFFIEHNANVFWDERCIYNRFRSYDVWNLHEQYMQLDDIIDVRSDALTHPRVTRRPFEHLVLLTKNDEMNIPLVMFRREEIENLLKFLHDRSPKIFSDPHILEFMNGGYEESWMPRFSTYVRKQKELGEF